MRWIAGGALVLTAANFLPVLGVIHPALGSVGYTFGVMVIFFVAPTLFVVGLTRIVRKLRS